ncbi:hypothetical protein [Xanthobacter flavus]|uniref:hypothetical protein n=1 Tax=Xanthobacter flavus TaxID=281 RepID=UPI0037294A2C
MQADLARLVRPAGADVLNRRVFVPPRGASGSELPLRQRQGPDAAAGEAATAFFPEAWLHLFSAEPAMVATGSAYLRGLALYFAALSVAPIVYAATILTAVKTGAWLR